MVKIQLKCPNIDCNANLGGTNFPQICSNCRSKILIGERERICPECLTILGGLKLPQICSKCGHKTTLTEIQKDLYIKDLITEIPNFHINRKEYQSIITFNNRHQHLGAFDESIRRAPYHIEIYPNSVNYVVIIVCDVCRKEYNKGLSNIEWDMDVTDYKSW